MSEFADITITAEQLEGTESVVSRWLKNPGDIVQQHEPIVEINTDKVTVEVAAPASGVLRDILKKEQQNVAAGEILGRIEIKDVASASAEKSQKSTAPRQASAVATSTGNQDLSPAVRKLLKENNIDASQVSGSGKDGRITHQDVMNFLETKKGAGSPKSSVSIPSRKVPHSAIRRSIAQHMVASLMHTAPHVTSVFEADMSRVIAHREKNKADFEKRGAKLTFTAYFIQATVSALKAVPEVNSRYHDTELEIFDDINIGVATAITSGEKGLLVPVLHKAQLLDLFGTAKKLQDLTERARSQGLSPSEVQGGTFTISNHGVSGSLFATPIIINQPQSAILGIGKLEQRVCAESNGATFVARPKVYVTLTIDHRVLDGFQANSFLQAFVERLEGWKD